MDPFIGTICAFGFNFAPYQWAVCGGQLIALNQNTALFALLGTRYGGDGRTTFGLPNLISRAAVGMGADTANYDYNQGATGGAESVTLTASNLPPHSHNVGFSINSNKTDTSDPSPVGHFPGNVDPQQQGIYAYASSPTNGKFMVGVPTITIGPAGTGGGQVAIRQPYLAANYCIALYGVFPSRAD